MEHIPLVVGSITNEIIQRYLTEWNTILFVIAACSLVAMSIFIERLLFIRRSEIDTQGFLILMRKSIEEGNIIDALKTCDETSGSIANIVRTGLLRHNRSRKDIESAMEITGRNEIAKLEKNAKILSMIAYLAPLIGLLGTVLGFIQAFSEMRKTGLMDISTTRVGEAMEYALVTTAAGLVVAIPCVVAYNFIISKIKTLTLDMYTTSSEIIDLLKHDEI